MSRQYQERIIYQDQLTDEDPNVYSAEEQRHPIGYKASNSDNR